MTYDGQRAMFEAYARNKYTSTGVIQWMLNNAWPSPDLASVRLLPCARQEGISAPKGMRTGPVQYSYDDNLVAVINGTYETLKGTKASAKIYNMMPPEQGYRETTLDLNPASAAQGLRSSPIRMD